MSTTALTITQQNNVYRVVSTAQIGPPGPAGAPGSAGPKGETGFPGVDITLTLDTDGNPVITTITHWWIDTDGSIYYEPDPANVPAGKEAWFDPTTFSVIPGLPGATFAVTRVNGQTGDVVIAADAVATTASLRTLGTAATQALPGNTPVLLIGSDAWLKQVVQGQDFTWSSATYDTNGALTAATVVWPDGVGGAYTATTVSTAFPGVVDAFTVTYVPSVGPAKTITQAAFTRNGSGRITAAPALTVT